MGVRLDGEAQTFGTYHQALGALVDLNNTAIPQLSFEQRVASEGHLRVVIAEKGLPIDLRDVHEASTKATEVDKSNN